MPNNLLAVLTPRHTKDGKGLLVVMVVMGLDRNPIVCVAHVASSDHHGVIWKTISNPLTLGHKPNAPCSLPFSPNHPERTSLCADLYPASMTFQTHYFLRGRVKDSCTR
jgi:hypothetical protein